MTADIKTLIAKLDVDQPTGRGHLNAIQLQYLKADDAAKSISALLEKSAAKAADGKSIRRISVESSPVNNALLVDAAPNDFEIGAGENLSRAELEQYVLRELLERDVRRRERSGEWANLVLRLKGLALGGGSPGEITAELRAFRDGADTGSAAGEEAAPC